MKQSRGLYLALVGCFCVLAVLWLAASCVQPKAVTVEPGAIEATGVHVGSEVRSPTTAGRDVWNISFGDVLGKAGWLLLPGVGAGWWMSKRRTVAALDTVIGAIEQVRCNDCKRKVALYGNGLVNKRVAAVSAKLKNGS